MLLIGYLKNGGAENSIVKLANELSQNHQVYLIVANSDKPDYSVNCEIIEIKELKNKLSKIIAIHKIRKLKKKLKIDVAISYTTVFNFVNVITKRNEKTIISIRNYLSLKEKELLYKLLHRISTKKSDVIICCSKAVMNDQINNYGVSKSKIKVIENFCNPILINPLANISVNFNHYIVAISRLKEHKGLKELIKAFKMVTDKDKNLKLLIFGRGPEEKKLKQLIIDLSLEQNVFLMGFTDNPYKYLKHAECFVLTSYYEGFSNSIIEAMTCSCPVVAVDSPGGNREILTDCYYGQKKKNSVSYGILVPNHDINNISDAILNVISRKDNYYQKLSLQRSRQYTKEKIMRKWYDVL